MAEKEISLTPIPSTISPVTHNTMVSVTPSTLTPVTPTQVYIAKPTANKTISRNMP